jgi:Arc/MetJ-type ribon-helix-helix transcriptional regulator
MNKLLTVLLVCCVAAIVWIMWACSLDTEAKLRLSGMVVQLYGFAAVALKLIEVTGLWQRLFPPPIVGSLAVTEEGDILHAHVTVPASTEEKLETLRQQFANHSDYVRNELKQIDQRISQAIGRERAERQLALEEARRHGHRFEWIGFWAFLLGTALQGASVELAKWVGVMPWC